MCDCLKNIEDSAKKEYGESAKIDKIHLFGFDGTEKIYPKISIKYHEIFRKKPRDRERILTPNFCPWCGEKYK